MPIQPIDNMLIAPRSQEATQVKHQEVTKVPHEQTMTHERFAQQVEQHSRQTVEVIKSENKEYRYDAKEKGNGSYSGNKRGAKKNEKQSDEQDKKPESKALKGEKGSSFDIRI